MALHSELTGADLHEPKGAETANVGEVYVADGAGSGSWQKVDTTSVDQEDLVGAVNYKIYHKIEDISTASNHYLPISHPGTVTAVTVVLDGAITVANTNLSFKNGGPTLMGTLAIDYTLSGAGSVYATNINANNNVLANSFILIECDGGASTASNAVLVIDITHT